MLSRRAGVTLAILLAVLIFAGFNLALGTFVTNARIDLTENQRFTLSSGTRSILTGLQEPIRLRFFYSRKTADSYPQTRAYAGRVRDLLNRYVALSHGKIILEEIDPEPFTPEEDEATAAGITPVATETGEAVYFGLVGYNRVDVHNTIAFFAADREPYLEYDLSQLIYHLSTPDRPKIAVLSGLPLDGGLSGQPMPIFSQMAQSFNAQQLPQDFTAIPAGVRVLVIIHPGTLTDAQSYAIDQFVLSGGRVALFVDPDSEWMAALRGASPMMTPPAPSNMARLMKAWGVGFDPGKEVLDLKNAQKVRTNDDAHHAFALYPAWLHITDGFDGADPVTANLQSINFASTGALFARKDGTTHVSPLIVSSDRAALADAMMVHSAASPDDLAADITPDGRHYVLAARITGPARTAFSAGPPAGMGGAQVKSARAINIVVVADSDVLDARFWLRDTAGKAARPIADNAAFLANILDNLSGSDALISLRTRSSGDKPFTLVRVLQADAEAQYRHEAERLSGRLEEARARLSALQNAGEKTNARQQAEISRFRADLIRTRTALRDVQHNLRKDIDALGDFLALINIVLMPVLVTLTSLVILWRRRRRQRRTVATSKQSSVMRS